MQERQYSVNNFNQEEDHDFGGDYFMRANASQVTFHQPEHLQQ